MMLKKIVVCGIMATLTISVTAQKKVAYVEYDLPNGMHVILHEEHSTPLTAVSIMYHVGSKNEKAERTGFAHFFEHLMFEGSQNIARGEYAKIVERNGGTLNANTSQDRTYYYEILPSNNTELGIWMEADRLLHAVVDSTGIETQRKVVKEEKRQRVDNQPYGTFMGNAFEKTFQSHQYKWMPIGSMEHLDAAQEIDYINFYRTYYVPSNAVLSIAGDINIEQTKAWVAKYFGSIPKGEAINVYRDYLDLSDQAFLAKYKVEKSKFDKNNFANPKDLAAKKVIATYSAIATQKAQDKARVIIKEAPLTKIITDTIYDNIQLPAVFMNYQFPAQNTADFYAVQMMNSVLSDGSSARMNKNIVERKQQAVAAFSFAFPLEDPGIGIVAAIAAGGKTVAELQTSLDEEIALIQSELISEDELQKVKNKYENDFVTQNASVAGIAENLAQGYTYFNNTDHVNVELSKYLAVTREDIKRVANKYLTQNARVILYYLPKK
jgi:zinc protease